MLAPPTSEMSPDVLLLLAVSEGLPRSGFSLMGGENKHRQPPVLTI